MYVASLAVVALMIALVLAWLAFLWWGRRSGQFRDIEAAKHQVFEDDDGRR